MMQGLTQRPHTGGRISSVTTDQVRQARALIDAGGSISSAARTLGLSRASLNRALDREHLSNRDMKAQVAAMKAELTALHAWLASAPSGSPQ